MLCYKFALHDLHIYVYMYFGLHDLYVCAFPLWFARFAQPTQWQGSTMERTCIDVFCTSYFPLRQQLSRQKRNSTCRYVFPILWVMPRLAQENSTRNINVRRCWWSNRSELALHHIFEWVNGGKSSLMSLGPAEIISADIFLQSATPAGEEGGTCPQSAPCWEQNKLTSTICLFDAISHHWFKKASFSMFVEIAQNCKSTACLRLPSVHPEVSTLSRSWTKEPAGQKHAVYF